MSCTLTFQSKRRLIFSFNFYTVIMSLPGSSHDLMCLDSGDQKKGWLRKLELNSDIADMTPYYTGQATCAYALGHLGAYECYLLCSAALQPQRLHSLPATCRLTFKGPIMLSANDKWRVQSHKIENKWVQNRTKQHKMINACPCINLRIKRTVSACMPPLYGVWAPLLSTTPVAASLPLDRVGSSSACAVLLGNSVSVLLSTPAIRAVNCWLQFHSDLESARQRSKAFAFKALKLIWNAKGLKGKWNRVYVFNGDRR